ncbi:enoyl-CoA hydratase/isomerase family protein [Planotetraspora sp. A-T 1434]|uniref:enoyl-CoA hydratase/isomerase family protein n=1 Tax=Planotetraspora sp. A-T 1434 TaxID=2979219 RepID=UPI0021C1EB90|nr:enoyl-CoA hydratase/isomerase family protein [Planotetraspora sp. A-T 1434]MCT9935371.1 enoyl-CoA hydratase/isomerase family protein [Planotetraspora sp. A-T 1434]
MKVTDGLELAIDEHVATLTLNRPEKRNAMTAAMWRAIPGVVGDLAADPAVRVLVLTGAAGTFSAGADIWEIAELSDNGDDTGLTVAAERALIEFPKPAIASIEGYCVGGGCQLALACDLRFASSTARFGITPAKLGIVYPISSTRRLAEIAGPATAKYLIFSAELVDAGHALRTGLVDEVLPPERLRDRVYGFAATLAHRSRLTLAAAKEIIDGRAGEEGFRAWQREARESGELAEGLSAFREGRSPRFF